MKEYIQFLVKENIKDIAENSYMNYGVKGLHMINLIDHPSKGLKLFITANNNNMQNSLPQNCANGITYPFSPYGRNITVQCIKGFVTIWSVKESLNNIALLTNEYQYVDDYSELKRENIGLETKQVVILNSGQSTTISGDEIINFGTRFGNTSAWFIYEGRQVDSDKKDFYFTNNEQVDGDLYITPSGKDIVALLNSIGLIWYTTNTDKPVYQC